MAKQPPVTDSGYTPGPFDVVENYQIPEFTEEFREVLAEEMEENGDIAIAFPVLKIPSGGGMAFTLPGDEGDVAKTIDVIIVDRFKANAYWENAFDGSNNPPDCSSFDGETGYGDPGGYCAGCEFNQFGSDPDPKSEGKACKNMIRTYILREGDMLPWKLDVPPTSMKAFSNYISSVVLKGKHPYGVITRVGLEAAKSANGIAYSKLTFKPTGSLGKDATLASKEYSGSIKMLTRGGKTEIPHKAAIIGSQAPELAGGEAAPDEDIF